MPKSDILDHPDLRKVWNALESEAPGVDWEDLTTHRSSRQLPIRKRRSSGLLVAAAVFTLVVVVGGVAWLIGRSGDPVPGGPLANLEWDLMVTFPAPADVEVLVDQIEAIEGVASVDYYPNVAVFYSEPPQSSDVDGPVTTIRANSGFNGEQPTTAAALLQLDELKLAETVAHTLDQQFDVDAVEYSEEIAGIMADIYFDRAALGATVIEEDSLLLQPPPGPQPEFDVAALGTEVVLVPATSADEVPETFWEMSANSMFDEDLDRSNDRPVLHIGYIAEIGFRFVVYGSVSGGRCETALMPGGGAGSGCDDFTHYPYGVHGFGGIEGGSSYVEVEVPDGTSVVVVTIDDRSPLWQRPVAGWAVFPAGDPAESVEVKADAYDSSGQLIGHWEQRS